MVTWFYAVVRWLMTWHERALQAQYERQERQGYTPYAVLYGAQPGESFMVSPAPGQPGKWRLETGQVVEPEKVWKIRNDRVNAGLVH